MLQGYPKVFSVAIFWGKICVVLAVLILLGALFTHRIKFVTADLGRHIQNGQVFFDQGHPIHTNFYSYTYPDYEVINHHWLTGVVFFLIHQHSGFEGLSYFYTLVFLLTVLLFFNLARLRSSFFCAVFLALVLSPLLTYRTEIRPEGFSVLLLGVFFYILSLFRTGDLKKEWLLVLPFLQVVWVNLHIYFVMGLILLGIFFIEELCVARRFSVLKTYVVIGSACLVACLMNPYGIHGALTPISIFKEYGYMLAENQSVIFMQKRFLKDMIYVHFEIVFLLLVMTWGWSLSFKKKSEAVLSFIVIVFFSLLAWKSIRNMTIFAFFCWPIAAQQLNVIVQAFNRPIGVMINRCFGLLCILLFFWIVLSKDAYFSLYQKLHVPAVWPELTRGNDWIKHVFLNPQILPGILPQAQKAALFFKMNALSGPIFNNYDIGGYLIYYLFPREKVFVDNRPEAYPASFFNEVYIPMQSDEKVWQQVDEKYKFNSIFFYRHDMTPWAQGFLYRRIQDPQWEAVFVDSYSIILLKRNLRNQAIIAQYGLPKEIFSLDS